MSPSGVKRESDVLRLGESVWNGQSHWMLVQHDGAVIIHKQRHGAASTHTVEIPRRTFQAMLDWYLRDQQ